MQSSRIAQSLTLEVLHEVIEDIDGVRVERLVSQDVLVRLEVALAHKLRSPRAGRGRRVRGERRHRKESGPHT